MAPTKPLSCEDLAEREAYRIGIDVGGTKIAIGLANANHEILSWVSIPTQDELGRESVLRRILDQIEALLLKHQVQSKQLVAVGLGFPCELDPITKLVKTAPNNQSFVDSDPGLLLQEALQARLGRRLPVWVDNDASVAALAEAKLGAGKDANRQLYLTISTDVGGARFDGQVPYNIEPGLFVFPDPEQPELPLLHLGGGIPAAQLAKSKIRTFIDLHGEQELSRFTRLFDLVAVPGETLADQIENLTGKILGEASMKGDDFAREIFIENARQVANGIAILLSEGFGEEKVILGGSVATKVPFYLDSVKATLTTLQQSQTANQALTAFEIEDSIVLAEIGDERGILGALLLTQQEKAKEEPIEVFVTGASGLVGGAVLSHFGKQYKVLGSYHRHSKLGLTKLDLTNRDQVFERLSKIQPKLVIHAAGLTDVDYCETHPQEAFAINVEGTRNIAGACQRMGCKLLFISTDCVFNGQNGPYREDDVPDPINVYGQSKLEAEQLVREICQDYLIVRCPLVFGKQSKIYQKLLRAKKEAVPVQVATDIFTNPISSEELAIFLLELITTPQVGLVHVGGEGYMSRFEFASQLATSLGVEQKYLVACHSNQLDYKAKRPKRGGLRKTNH